MTTADCWALVDDPIRCPGEQYLVQLRRTVDEIAAGPLTDGTRLQITCQ